MRFATIERPAVLMMRIADCSGGVICRRASCALPGVAESTDCSSVSYYLIRHKDLRFDSRISSREVTLWLRRRPGIVVCPAPLV